MSYFIAEIGVNWRVLDDIPVMMHQAKCAGANAVKVQVFNEDNVKGKLHADVLGKLILHEEDIRWLAPIAHSMGMTFIATPMYPAAVDMCKPYVDALKVRFEDRSNLSIVDPVLKVNKPVYISCDEEYMANPPEAVQKYDKKVLMFCVPEYPPKQVRIPRKFDWRQYGFSSHYPNWVVPAAFGAMGFLPIECHVFSPELHPTTFLVDKGVSLTFQQFAVMVYSVTKVKPLALEGAR